MTDNPDLFLDLREAKIRKHRIPTTGLIPSTPIMLKKLSVLMVMTPFTVISIIMFLKLGMETIPCLLTAATT